MVERDLFVAEPPPRPMPTIPDNYEPVRPDGQFACCVCGAPASFGSGVNMRKRETGVWLCFEHWRGGVG